jgi:hypothetical protein
MQNKKLKIIPLGGLGEFGMNCLAIRWEDDIIVIDAGLMFPETELLGVDVVVPDITYLVENKEHVRGIILTHGHEDHIGGLPWILSDLKVPVYATEFTLAYVEGKLEEHELLDETTLIEITPKEKFSIGPFTIEPIRVTHSLVDCVALAVTTRLSTCIRLRNTESVACWRCCRTRRMLSGRDIRPASGQLFPGCMRFFRRRRRSCSSAVFRRRFTGFGLRLSWRGNMGGRPWCWAGR